MPFSLLPLFEMLDASPSPFHAAAWTAERLDEASFTSLDPTKAWSIDEVGSAYVIRGGTIIAWRLATSGSPAPFRIVGAHTDSPNLRVKPQPDRATAGIQQLGVEVYGGALLNSWLDRDLGLSGRVSVRTKKGINERLLLVDRPLLRVPQLAIHLDTEIREAGLKLNPQTHLSPMWALGDTDTDGFRRFIAKELRIKPETILSWDLMAHDLTPASTLGRSDEFMTSARLDNLVSCWAGTTALTTTSSPAKHALLCLYDHEEVGSTSDRGAAGSLLSQVLERITLALDGSRPDHLRALAGSRCLSADMAHATHPNYADRHEPQHQIALNGGVVVKSNANLRYASDAASTSIFEAACADAGVPVQRFVSRTDMPCGSTIGPFTAAQLAIPTVDVGIAQLSMHSTRELCGAGDPEHYTRAMSAWFDAS